MAFMVALGAGVYPATIQGLGRQALERARQALQDGIRTPETPLAEAATAGLSNPLL